MLPSSSTGVIGAYGKVVKRVQAAYAEEDQAREALAKKLDQLMSLVSSDPITK